MGLNVYFCDVCGVRVTDVDLRSGHGMLRGHDVICATCLEMGHGKEWLANRGMAEPLTATVAPDQGLSGAADVNMVINFARDRAVTVPDEPSESGPRTAIDYEDTRAVAIQQEASFSGAAAGFAALNSQPNRPIRDDDGHLDEESSDHVDPVLLNETPAETQSLHENQHPDSPFSSDLDDDLPALSPALAKSKSSSSSRIISKSKSDRLRNAAAGRGSQSSASKSSSKRGSSTMNPTSSSKPSTTKSSKVTKSSAFRPKNGNGSGLSMPLKVSIITVPLLLLLVLLLIFGGSSGTSKQADVKDLQAQKMWIEKEFSTVKSTINDAYMSKNMTEMEAANQRWQQFLGEWDSFAKDAQRYSGWTEEQCSSYWEGLRAPDVGARTRLLRDEIAKQRVR